MDAYFQLGSLETREAFGLNLSRSSFRTGFGGREAKVLWCSGPWKSRARIRNMSERSRLVAEAGQQVSNPFLLCALVSRRTRQLMMAGNADTNTAQVVDSALCEVIAGVLEFKLGKRRRPFVDTEESPSEEIDGQLETSRDLDIPAAAPQVEAP